MTLQVILEPFYSSLLHKTCITEGFRQLFIARTQVCASFSLNQSDGVPARWLSDECKIQPAGYLVNTFSPSPPKAIKSL